MPDPKPTPEEIAAVEKIRVALSELPPHLALMANHETASKIFIVRQDADGGLVYADWSGQTVDPDTIIGEIQTAVFFGRDRHR